MTIECPLSVETNLLGRRNAGKPDVYERTESRFGPLAECGSELAKSIQKVSKQNTANMRLCRREKITTVY